MKTDSQSPSAAFRWLKVEHKDLQFWGIEPPVPWPPKADTKVSPEGDFPFVCLLEGIELLRAAGGKGVEKWDAVKRFIERGEELGDALESGDLAATLRLLDELERLRPGTPYGAFNRAFVLKAMGDRAGALAASKEATRRAPRLEHLWMRRGELHEEMETKGDDEKAVFCYRRALALLPNHQQALEGLSRLGAMVKLVEHLPDGRHRMRFFSPDEFRKHMGTTVARLSPDAPELRQMLRQFLEKNDGDLLLEVVDRILSGQPEDALALRVQRADALRMLKRFKQAEQALARVLAEDPENAEAHYVRAWCHFDSGKTDEGWHEIRETLRLDPNHQKAIQVKFRIGPKNRDLRYIDVLSEWADREGSWRGHWLASVHANTLGEEAAALRCAEAAYKMAPEERDAVWLYANTLNNLGEGEHTAALVHPRLPEAKGDYLLKYIFAGAMKKLGLPEVAIRVLRESLEEESDMTLEWRQNTQHFLDLLTGLVAKAEVELEFHPNTDTMRREVWLGDDAGPDLPFLQAGASVPLRRVVRLTPRVGYSGSTGSVAVYHHGRHSGMEPLSLGWFQAHEIDFGEEAPPEMTLEVTKDEKLEASACQGDRRLPVTWSLYRAPSMEFDPSTSDPE
jgi:tetratricopeptide (TPR) repeat protein